MPVKAEKACFWVPPISSMVGLPPAVQAARMTVFSSASVEARCVPSVGATVLPAVKPPEAPPAPRETLLVDPALEAAHLARHRAGWAAEAWFWQAMASRSILARRPASAVW